MRICPKCTHENGPNALFCGNCKHKFSPISMGQDQPARQVAPPVMGRQSRISAYAETDIGQINPPSSAGGVPKTQIRPKAGLRCQQCGRYVGMGDNYCPSCGKPLKETAAPKKQSNTMILTERQVMRLKELSSSGTPIKELSLDQEETVIGAQSGDFVYPDDSRMSPEHVRIVREYDGQATRHTIADLDTDYGTFIQLRPDHEWQLFENAEFIIGQQLLRFGIAPQGPGIPGGKRFQISILDQEGQETKTYPARIDGNDIGRSEGHIQFPDDMLVSSLHARVVMQGSSFFLRDMGSKNGVFYRIVTTEELTDGDLILIGTRRFRFVPAKAVT